MELVGDAAIASPDAVEVPDPHLDALSGLLAGTGAKVISLTPNLYDLVVVYDKAKREHKELFKKV